MELEEENFDIHTYHPINYIVIGVIVILNIYFLVKILYYSITSFTEYTMKI